MKIDEDLGPDREDQFQTDDEENQGERFCQSDSDSESDSMDSSQYLSNNSFDVTTLSWPQSYRLYFIKCPNLYLFLVFFKLNVYIYVNLFLFTQILIDWNSQQIARLARDFNAKYYNHIDLLYLFYSFIALFSLMHGRLS
jgi:hypothetical protein